MSIIKELLAQRRGVEHNDPAMVNARGELGAIVRNVREEEENRIKLETVIGSRAIHMVENFIMPKLRLIESEIPKDQKRLAITVFMQEYYATYYTDIDKGEIPYSYDVVKRAVLIAPSYGIEVQGDEWSKSRVFSVTLPDTLPESAND